MTLYSIITINKNNIAGLQKTFNSLLHQTYLNWEWIVVDGVSSDGAPAWLSTLNDKRITWLSEKDRGIYNAMNKGIRLAKGDFSLFLNSGDCFAEDQILNQLSQNIKDSAVLPGFIYGDVKEITPSGEIYYKRARPHHNVWLGMFTSHQSMLFNQELFKQLKYHEEWNLSADYGLVCAIFKTFEKSSKVYFNAPISQVKLGGLHEGNRLTALTQDYQIRRQILKLSMPLCGLLWVLHWFIFNLKKHPALRRVWYKIRGFISWKE